MSSLPSISPPASNDPARPAGASAVVARVTICVLLVIVPLMVGAVYWRWATVHEPTTDVIVRGDASLDGAKIEVTGGGKKWAAELSQTNGWQVPVLLDPGDYQVRVTAHGKMLFESAFSVDNTQGRTFELSPMIWVVGNPWLADATVEFSRLSPPIAGFTPPSVTLFKTEEYRARVYLPPGMYRAVARNKQVPDQVMAQVEFTVDRKGTAPLRVDLARGE